MRKPAGGSVRSAMTHYMNEVMALYRGVFRTENRWTCWWTAPPAPVSKRDSGVGDPSGRQGAGAGVPAVWSSAVRDCAPLPRRQGYTPSEVPWGKSLPRTRLRDAIGACARACCSPCRAIPRPAAAGRLGELSSPRCAVLYRHHRVARQPAGNRRGELDAVSAGMQKCSGGPPAPRPSPSAHGWKRSIRRRRCIEQGSAPMPTTMASTR